MQLKGRLAAAVMAGVALLGVSACSNDAANNTTGTGTASTAPTPAERLGLAKKAVDAASSVHLKLEGKDIPDKVSGIISADGWGKHPPAFKGTFKVSVSGIQADAEIIAVDGGVWAKLPLIPGMNKIDPKQYGLPDPAGLFAPEAGITTLLTDTTAPTAGEQTRKGSEVLTTISGKLPGQKVTSLFLVGDANATYDVTYKLTDANELREVAITGPFYPGKNSTYALTLDQYNAPMTIEKPS